MSSSVLSDMRQSRVSLIRSDKSHKTHTVNVLKIASKLTIDLVSSLAKLFSKSMLCKSRKSKESKSREISITYIKNNTWVRGNTRFILASVAGSFISRACPKALVKLIPPT